LISSAKAASQRASCLLTLPTCSPKMRATYYSRLQKSGHFRSGNGREVAMLTRRGFSGFASCAICGLTGFVATDASAQGSPPAGSPSFRRKILSQTDGPVPGYVTIIVDAEVDPGVTVPRHTHPGIESAYVVEGSLELPIEGQPTRTYNPGDSYQVPTGTPHAGGKPSDKKIRFTATYVVERDKPLASPA
jgi:quercetin dioxygenase-like cupin family protein